MQALSSRYLSILTHYYIVGITIALIKAEENSFLWIYSHFRCNDKAVVKVYAFFTTKV